MAKTRNRWERMYLDQLKILPKMTVEQEAQLFDQMHDPALREKVKKSIMQGHLLLVVSIVDKLEEKIEDKHATFLRLVQVGNEGLLKAIDTYAESDRSADFEQWAIPEIASAIATKYLGKSDEVLREFLSNPSINMDQGRIV